MGGIGSASPSGDEEFFGASTRFDVTFDVREPPTRIAFSALFTYIDEFVGGLVYTAALTRGEETIFREALSGESFPDYDGTSNPVDYEVAFEPALAPGRYDLLVNISPVGGFSNGSFDFALMVLPEPGAMSQVLVIAALCMIRRRVGATSSRRRGGRRAVRARVMGFTVTPNVRAGAARARLPRLQNAQQRCSVGNIA